MRKGTLDSSLYLFEQASQKIGFKSSERRLRLLNEVITVFLRSIKLFDNLKMDVITLSIHKVELLLDNWIKKALVNPFGASTYGSKYWSEQNAVSEIKVAVCFIYNDKNIIILL